MLNPNFIEARNQLPSGLSTDLGVMVGKALGDIFPAMALVILHRGETVFEGSWGWIDPDSERFPVTPDSWFDLASVSKLFTATAFLTFVSEGRVKLDDPLVAIIPEFGASGPRSMDGGQDPFTKVMLPVAPEYQHKKIDPSPVTFRQLLAHISGLAPWRAVYLEAGPTPLPPDQIDPVDRHTRWNTGLQAVYGYPFVDIPGRDIHYSDLGLILLGEALARLHGAPLDAAVAGCVLEPLELVSVVYNPLQHGCQRENLVPTEEDRTWRGRRCWGEVHDENTCGLGGVSGHAGLFAAARDVASLGLAWLTHDPRLKLSPEVIAEATRQQAINETARRGLGWQLQHPTQTADGGSPPLSSRAFGHTGFTGTSLWVDPERDLVVACLTNRVYVGREKPGMDIFRAALHRTIARRFSDE